MKTAWILALSFSLISSSMAVASFDGGQTQGAAAKYPADVEPLSRDNSYVRRNPAPDFWAAISFLTAQHTNSSCSLAAATQVLNAARRNWYLKKDDPLLTFESVLKTTGDATWKKATANNGGGVSLQQFDKIMEKALVAHGIQGAIVRRMGLTSQNNSQYREFIADLRENERSAGDFMILNFDQGFVMDDETVGHFAVVGAYDEDGDRVLILDPDKNWYEPYWVPTQKLFRSMYGARGYLWIDLKPGFMN